MTGEIFIHDDSDTESLYVKEVLDDKISVAAKLK